MNKGLAYHAFSPANLMPKIAINLMVVSYNLGSISSRLIEKEWMKLHSLVQDITNMIERKRGEPYSGPYRNRKENEIEKLARSRIEREARRALKLVASGLRCPTKPKRDIQRYDHALAIYEMEIFRKRIEPSSPGPEPPPSVIEYERKCSALDDVLRARAIAKRCYWFRSEFLSEIRAEIICCFVARARRAGTRRPPVRSTPLSGRTSLVGEHWHSPEPANGGLVSKGEAMKLSGLPLVFLEDLKIGSQNRAQLERESESITHNELVHEMTRILLRLNYKVYPGGVGIAETFSMADMLAIDTSTVLFVECLTKKSIALGQHEKKFELARRVPFCFVGEIPSEFLSKLPGSSYAISYPRSPKMLGDIWVPLFYRRSPHFQTRFTGKAVHYRVRTCLEIELPEIRLAEDASGFLWNALSEAIHSTAVRGIIAREGWQLKSVSAAYGSIPFEQHGRPHSVFAVSRGDSSLEIHLGVIPVRAELRGSGAALELVQKWLFQTGFPLQVSYPFSFQMNS